MKRIAIATVIAAGLVATAGGPAFAGKPGSTPTTPNYALTSYNNVQPAYGVCDVSLYAKFTSTPTKLPTAWRFNVNGSTQNIPAAANGDASGYGMLVTFGTTLNVTVAPVYNKAVGASVSTAPIVCG